MDSLPHYDPGASLWIDLNNLEVTWQRNVPRQARALVDPTRCPLIEAAYHEAGHAAVALAVGIRFTAHQILKEPAVSRGMEAIAGALLRRQWLPYVAARAVYGAAADLGV